MESKKINQLATELAPDLSDLTIIGDPTTGISKKITLSQMASLFTGTVEEYATLAAFPLVGVADTIYIALDTNILYRWNTGTSAYVELSPNIVSSLVFNDANGFDGTINLVGSVATLTITTALTTGSVGFIGASGALLQDNANFFWDDTNNRLGLGTNAPTTALDVFGSGIIGRINGNSTNNAFLGFASAGTNKWSAGNVQSDHRFRIFSEANSAELITILQTGEFGIGIANPTTKFHIDGGASALIANLDANVSVAKSVSFRSDNSNRFNIEVSGTESGSNAGADFFIRRYSDAGSLIDTPLTIIRSTGNATFSGILTTPQVKAATSAGLSINANSGTQVADFGAGGSANITFFGGLSGTSATFSGITSLTSATASTSTTTGGLVVTGGVGIGGALFGTSAVFNHNDAPSIKVQRNGGTDTNTALEFTNASRSFFIGSNGTVMGLGGTSGTISTQPLQISSTGAATLTGEVTISSGLLSISGSGGSPPTSGVGLRFVSNRLLIYGGSSDITFQKNSNASANMTILESGNVGIGVTPATVSGIIELAVGGASSNPKISGIRDGANAFMIYSASGGTEIFERRSGELVLGTNNTGRIWITSGGNVLIGKSTTGVDTNGFRFDSNGVFFTSVASGENTYYLRDTTNAVYRFYVTSGGTINATNTTISAISDGRLKENIVDLEIGLDAIMALKPRQFDWKKESGNDGKNVRGFIAQEFEEIFPDLIDESINPAPEGEQPYKQIRQDLIPVLVKAIQEQQAQIEELKAKIK